MQKVSNAFIIFVCLFLINRTAYAIKNPGYVGKKNVFSIGYNPYFLGVTNVTNSVLELDNSATGFIEKKMFHGLTLDFERAISSRIALSIAHVGYQFQAQQITRGPFLDAKGNNLTFFNQVGVDYNLVYSHTHFTLKVYQKSKGSIAPLGRYVGFTFGQSKSIIKNMKVYEYDPLANNFFDKALIKDGMDQRFYFSLPNMGLEIGANRILKDKLLLGYFFNTTFRLSSIANPEYKELDGYDKTILDEDFLNGIKNINTTYNFLRIGIKLGYII